MAHVLLNRKAESRTVLTGEKTGYKLQEAGLSADSGQRARACVSFFSFFRPTVPRSRWRAMRYQSVHDADCT
eukprot:1776656-Pleurochrysis_carterae.AAC.3